MNLPPLTLPKVPIPFDIPQMLHPMVVHFAIALPIVVLLLEIINLFVKKRAIGVMSFFLLLLGSATLGVAYLTGNVDATIANTAELIKEHQTLGAYLVVLSAVVLGLKLISVILRAGIIKALYMMLLILLSAGVCKAGFDGIKLVYDNGINVKKVNTLQTSLTNKDAQIKKLNDAYHLISKDKEELKVKVQELNDTNTQIKEELSKLKEKDAKTNQANLNQPKESEALEVSDTNNTVDEANITSVVDDINQTDIVKDTNIIQK